VGAFLQAFFFADAPPLLKLCLPRLRPAPAVFPLVFASRFFFAWCPRSVRFRRPARRHEKSGPHFFWWGRGPRSRARCAFRRSFADAIRSFPAAGLLFRTQCFLPFMTLASPIFFMGPGVAGPPIKKAVLLPAPLGVSSQRCSFARVPHHKRFDCGTSFCR